jgi:hypothetical protein
LTAEVAALLLACVLAANDLLEVAINPSATPRNVSALSNRASRSSVSATRS